MNLRALLPVGSQPKAAGWVNAAVSSLSVIAGLTLLAAFRWEWINILPTNSDVVEATEGATPSAPPVRVQLTPDKLVAANLHITAAEFRTVQPTRTVPGTIRYDDSRRVPVNSPVAGVIVRVLVEPGQIVAAHQPLAIASSPEVGASRDEVMRREAELSLARKQQSFRDNVAANVEQLLALLKQRPKLQDVQKSLEGRALGEYRGKLFSAYSKLALSESRLTNAGDLKEALSRRALEEWKSQHEIAAAEFAAECEMAQFSLSLERDKYSAATEQAERLLEVARQALANLLGPLADPSAVSNREKLSELVLLAPIAGRVEERQAVAATRIALGSPLFIVADTSTLWVSAEIHERDWATLDAAREGEIAVRIPALGDIERKAKVQFVGASVSADTRSVPLVAEIDNRDGRLRPGMFVWALVPLTQPRQSIVVPRGAIMRHENQAFVFVPDGKEGFRRVDVQTEMETASGVEIRSGLKSGEMVVDGGAFFLKSELLLERED
jgi:membrane fusion protein, heavy metal efflux system